MAIYQYKARDKRSNLIKGEIEANTEIEAKRALSAKELFIIEIRLVNNSALSLLLNRWKNYFLPPVSLVELIVFNRQLQTSYSVGISILQALKLICEQTDNQEFRKVLQKIIEDVSSGHALHEALEKHPAIFDSVYINAIKAGESSGSLDEILEMLCYFTEQRLENQNKIKSATLYPKIILTTILVVMLVVFYFIIPKIKGFYDRYGSELPPLTLFVMHISDFLIQFWYLVLLASIGSYIGIKHFLQTKRGKILWDTIQLKIPVFGIIFLQTDMFTFSTVLHLLLKSGLPILDSLKIVRDSVSNQIIKDEVDTFSDRISEGRSISSGFRESNVFPKLLGSLLYVSEESGRIDEVLEKVSKHYKLQLEYRLNNLAKSIEPIFLFLIFGVILVLVLSVFLPIWKMSQVMKMK